MTITDRSCMNHPNPKMAAKALNAFEVAVYQHFCAAVLDFRPKTDFVTQHIPGAFHIDLAQSLREQIECVGSANTPLVLFFAETAQPDQYEAVMAQIAEVGYQNISGYMSDALVDWEAVGLPLTSGDVENIQPQVLQTLLAMPDGQRPILLDVREPREFENGFVPTAQLVPLESLPERLSEFDKNQPVAVMCQTGGRSQAAASLLGLRGFAKVYNVLGGTRSWTDQGLPLERLEKGKKKIIMQQTQSELGTTFRLNTNFDNAQILATEALKTEGFGVLTEIDVKATMKKKLDVEFRPYKILGACNPHLAYRALTAAPEIGLLLPCNVTVSYVADDITEVALVSPLSLMSFVNRPELAEIAEEANTKLKRVAAALADQS